MMNKTQRTLRGGMMDRTTVLWEYRLRGVGPGYANDTNNEEARFPWLIGVKPIKNSIPHTITGSEELAKSIVEAHNRYWNAPEEE